MESKFRASPAVVYFHSSSLDVKSKIEKQYSSSPSNFSSYSHFATLASHVKTAVTLQKIKKLFPTRVFTRLFIIIIFFSFLLSLFLFPSLLKAHFLKTTPRGWKFGYGCVVVALVVVVGWSSCGGWVGVLAGVLDFLGVGLLEFLRWLGWCSIGCFGLGLLADLGVVLEPWVWLWGCRSWGVCGVGDWPVAAWGGGLRRSRWIEEGGEKWGERKKKFK